VNETTATASGLPSSGDAAMRALQHVGAAYGLIFLLVVAFAWRATAATRRLAERVDDLERRGAPR
jgi:hypothetical protein